MTQLQPGDIAPDFTLHDQDGTAVSLQEFRGRPVILYFYPAAMTPGCTTQACDFTESLSQLKAHGYTVLGVSPDAPERLAKFRDKETLGITLLSDPDHATLEAYGAWGEKSMYGKKYMGMLRSTFIIGPDGKIARVFPKVQPKKHDDLVLKALAEL